MENFEEVKAVLDAASRKALELMDATDWEDIGELDDVYCSRRQT